MPTPDDEEDTRSYTVVVNDEEQYSIWLATKEVPAGWRTVGVTGAKDECLDYIEEHWTDMRPLSVRQRIEADSAALRRDRYPLDDPGPPLLSDS